jgi:hypothetical protein
MPLLVSLILKKGNLWKISKHLPLYREDDIHEVFGSEYLPKIEDSFMPTIYLSQTSSLNLKNKHIFCIFSPKTMEYIFLFLDNSLGKNSDELLRLARRTIQKEDAKISVVTKPTEREIAKEINEALKALEKTLNQTFLIILESSYEVPYLRSMGIECLEEEMPVLKLPVSQS